jgi:hypothetical protein
MFEDPLRKKPQISLYPTTYPLVMSLNTSSVFEIELFVVAPIEACDSELLLITFKDDVAK